MEQIDEVTQSTAANAEEFAAAAAVLSSESEKVTRLVETFTLGEDSRGGAPLKTRPVLVGAA